MSKILMGLLLGFLIGVGCRYFDIPLPSPPKVVGVLVALSMTLGYVGMNSLLTRQAAGRAARPATTALYCGGSTGLPPSQEQAAVLSQNAPRTESDRPVH